MEEWKYVYKKRTLLCQLRQKNWFKIRSSGLLYKLQDPIWISKDHTKTWDHRIPSSVCPLSGSHLGIDRTNPPDDECISCNQHRSNDPCTLRRDCLVQDSSDTSESVRLLCLPKYWSTLAGFQLLQTLYFWNSQASPHHRGKVQTGRHSEILPTFMPIMNSKSLSAVAGASCSIRFLHWKQ